MARNGRDEAPARYTNETVRTANATARYKPVPHSGGRCKSARGPNEQEFGSSQRFQFPGFG